MGSRVDVRSEMDLAVKAAGGEALDETLPPSRSFMSADYLFRSDSVIAELKQFEHSGVFDAKFIKKASELYLEWRASRKDEVPLVLGKSRIRLSDFPELYKKQHGELMVNLFRSIFKKASKQVAGTRANLDVPDGWGVLLLCIDGENGFALAGIMWVIGQLLRRHSFSGINGLMVFSGNYAIASEKHGLVRPLLYAARGETPDPARGVMQRLSNAWCDRMATAGGPQVLVLGHEDEALLAQVPVPIRPA